MGAAPKKDEGEEAVASRLTAPRVASRSLGLRTLSVIFPLPGAAATSLAVARQNFSGVIKDPDIVGRVARGPKASRGGFFSIFFDRSFDHRLMPLRPTQFLRH
jgi:hypothetical protein